MKILLFLFFSAIIFCGCNRGNVTEKNKNSQNTETLTVSAAISLKDAFDEIGKSFELKKRQENKL